MKNKQILYMTLLTGIGLSTTFDAESTSFIELTANITAKVGVTTCVGAQASCGTTINAVGENVTIDVSKYEVTSLGKVDQEIIKSLDMPIKQGTMKIYSFTPTQGELANKLIYVVFDNIAPRAGSLAALKKNTIKVYRRTQDEPNNQWVEVSEITTNQPVDKLPFSIEPSGVWSVYDNIAKKTIAIDLGKKDILMETEQTKA